MCAAVLASRALRRKAAPFTWAVDARARRVYEPAAPNRGALSPSPLDKFALHPAFAATLLIALFALGLALSASGHPVLLR